MCCKDHAAISVGDAFAGVGGDVVEELCDGVIGCFCGRGLLSAKLPESHNQLVIDGAAIKQERAPTMDCTRRMPDLSRGSLSSASAAYWILTP